MSNVTISGLANGEITLESFLAFAGNDGVAFKSTVDGLNDFINTISVLGLKTAIVAADAAPTEDGLYPCSDSGTYTNYGGLVVNLTNKLTFISVSGTQTVFKLVEIPLSIVLDSSVTEGSANAPTGKAVYNFNYDEFLDFIISLGSNLFNKSTVFLNEYINSGNGFPVTGQTDWWRSDYIKVEESAQYRAFENIRDHAFYDENKVYISGSSSVVDDVTSPVGAKFFRFSHYNVPIDDKMIVKGAVKPTVYEDYERSLNYQLIKSVIEENEITHAINSRAVINYVNDVVKPNLYIASNNLLNPSTVVEDAYINWSTGVPVTGQTDWWYTDYIEVNPSTQYRSLPSVRDLAYYDENKVYISGNVSVVDNITTPALTKYIRFSNYQTDFNYFMFNEGASVLPFVKFSREYKYPTEPDIKMVLPPKIDLVVGDTFQLYYNTLIAFPNWEQYHFASTLADGNDLKRYVELIPSVAGDVDLTIAMYNGKNILVDKQTITISVKDAVAQPATTVNYWNVGDSLTEDGTYPTEMLRRLTGTGGAPAGNNFGNIVQHTEGNSGKEWNWYVTSVDSPFVYGGVLDFEQYRVDNALAVPEVVYILLTWNGMNTNRTELEWNVWDDDVYTFIDALKVDFPSVEVKLVSPNFPSQNGGLGYVDGAYLEGYSNTLISNNNALKQAKIYEAISLKASYSTWIEHVQSALQIDSLYNFAYTDKNVNSRNSSITEKIGTNDVHPTTEGYYQIADALYRNFINNYCQ